jgi:hypothetical protein
VLKLSLGVSGETAILYNRGVPRTNPGQTRHFISGNRRTFFLTLTATGVTDELWVLMPLTTRKGASSAFIGQR